MASTTSHNKRARERLWASPAWGDVRAGGSEAGKPGNQRRPWDLVQRRRRRASSPNQGGTGREHPGGARDSEPGAHPAATGTDRHSGTAYPDMAFTTLAHHLDVAMLERAFQSLNPHSAPGVDRVTWQHVQGEPGNQPGGITRETRQRTYCPQPVVRRLIPKSNGKLRPLGLPALEDKIVAKAVAMLLEAIYEQDFCDASYGFRPGRSPHHALHEVRQGLLDKRDWVGDRL